MELLICGTAAAEGWPALFCVCDACVKARQLGGKNIRTRAAYMIDDRIRVDFGPDSYMHQLKYGLQYEKLEHLIITHAHSDHWYPTDVHYRRRGYSVIPKDSLLYIWGNEKVYQKFEQVNPDHWDSYKIVFKRITPWRRMDLGQGMLAVPVPAAHDTSEECVNYVIRSQEKALLIGHDTGWYEEPTWMYLANQSLNVVLLDCTYGPNEYPRGHLGCEGVVRARDELARRNALAPGARVLATHFSHNGGWLHEQLEEYFAPHGIEVAYDGMRITI